jgi:glutathione synthase/RimK-type ligase-like ATP-grasp enzyme
MPAEVDLATLSADEVQFRTARFELMARINDMGHYGCIVTADSYKGGGVFAEHLYPVDAKTLRLEQRGEITLDALYDKTKLYPADLPHITDKDVGAICNDKARTHEVAGDLQPQTRIIASRDELATLGELDNGSGMVALKSFNGFGGEEVWIGKISELGQHIALPEFPLLAQEFIESDKGVPGLTDGRHDVRILILNGTALGGSIRTPQPGGLLSNTHQGGTMRMLALVELPKELLAFAAQVDARLPQKPRLYAADFMYSAPLGRWFLIELNGSPGALPSTFTPVGPVFQQELAKSLLVLAGE